MEENIEYYNKLLRIRDNEIENMKSDVKSKNGYIDMLHGEINSLNALNQRHRSNNVSMWFLVCCLSTAFILGTILHFKEHYNQQQKYEQRKLESGAQSKQGLPVQ